LALALGLMACGGKPPAPTERPGLPARVGTSQEGLKLYTGPLFLVHEHLSGITPEKLQGAIRLMDRGGISKAVAFIRSRDLPLVSRYRGKLIPFDHDHHVMDVSEYPAHLRKVFSADRAWAGTGELGGGFIVGGQKLGKGFGTGRLAADHPAMLRIYDVAAEFDKVVMAHPENLELTQIREGRNPLHWSGTKALERALSHNRRTVFLIHGVTHFVLKHVYMGNISYDDWHAWYLTLLDRHPNWFFDPSMMLNHHAWWDPEFFLGRPTAGPQNEKHHVEVRERRTAEEFLAHMRDEAHFAWHVDLALKDWERLFRAKPDRFMVGFDFFYNGRAAPWHLNPEVYATFVRLYRAILGRLPPDAAEQIAYGNAERVIASRSK
jgi:hypothetical protein